MSNQPSIDVKPDSSRDIVTMTNAMSPSAILTNQNLEPLLSIHEVARILAVSPATIRTWIHRNRLPYVKMGRRVGFHPESIRNFIAKNTRAALG
jgi:excisionase family DNA binding protein